jgi:ribonuclease VapC
MNVDTVIVDASVIVAIFKQEPDASELIKRLSSFQNRFISAPNYFEAAIVCESWGMPAFQEFDATVSALNLQVIPATLPQMEIARNAHRRFGKGRGRPGVLNVGDCFAYALAKDSNAPLLFKGRDFSRTDIESA